MTSTPPPTVAPQSNSAAISNPAPPSSATAGTAGTPGPTSTHKRRPYEDPTDGERFQLYQYSRAHPELKQKDLVTWFASKFGKEINQSTVSRALKRYRDNPPENPETAVSAKSKRGGGGVSSAATGSPAAAGGTTGSNKRRRTGAGPAPGTIPVTGTGGMEGEEETARVDEQVQRENRNANGQKPDIGGNVEGDVVLLPYQQHTRGARIAAQQPQQTVTQPHHHHGLHHSIQPLHQGAPQAPMQGQFQAQALPGNHVNNHLSHLNHYAPASASSAAQQLDIDSDSDSDGENGAPNVNGTYQDDLNSFTSDDVELTNLHRRYESILLRSVLASGGAPGVTLPADLSSLTAPGENTATDTPTGETGSDGQNGTGTSHPTLSRESLVMYVVGRNELVRSLQGRVAGMEKEVARLRKKVARREELVAKLKRGEV